MARTRSIKPGFFHNDELADLDPLARLLFAGLWTVADREGRLYDRPRKIKAAILPYDECDIDAFLNDLQSRGFINRYLVGAEEIIQVHNWSRHQNPHQKEPPSTIPKEITNGAIKNTSRASGKSRTSTRRASDQSETSMSLGTASAPDEHQSSPAGTRNPEPDHLNPEPDNPPTPLTDLDVVFSSSVSAPNGTGGGAQSKKSKGAAVIDLIRAGGVEPVLSGRDHGAIKRTNATAALIAEAFLAAYSGAWNPGGKGWLRDNLAVWAVIERLSGYQASKTKPVTPTPIRSGWSGRVNPHEKTAAEKREDRRKLTRAAQLRAEGKTNEEAWEIVEREATAS